MILRKHDRLNVRNTHPALYRSITTLSVMCVALAVNFWTSTPTFNPYNIPKNWIGAVFAVLGIYQLVFLNVVRDLRRVRFGLAVSFSWILFWGISNTQQAFAGNASFQLPILLSTLAVLHLLLLVESPVNPMTQRDG